jgi:FMN-dependent NADH-azoreductase
MKTLLKITASIAGENASSSQLADRYAADWLDRHPGGRIVTRDLSRDPVPHIDAARFGAFLSSPEQRTADQQAVVDYSDALIAELREADVVVLAVPMYNFSVPSTLRAYFDHIARAGVTFRYGTNGAEGLLTGKKAVVFITRGGIHSGAADTQTPYLRQFLGFVGIEDVEFVHAEGLAYGAEVREKSLAAARDRIVRLLPRSLAA